MSEREPDRPLTVPTADYEVDVVVVGGGACGMMTALRALDAGVQSVAVFEKSVRQGCNTQFSSGSLAAGGTRFQAAAGVKDSPERHAEDLMRVSGDRRDEKIVRALCDVAPRYVEWLADEIGYPVELGVDMPRAGQSVPRLHTDVGRQGGRRLVDALRHALLSRSGAVFVDNTPGTGLVTDGDRVTGVRVREPDGERVVQARAVVLAADGFGANQSMLAAHTPDAIGRLYGGVSTSTGEAISWGTALGAETKHMAAFLGHGLMVLRTGTRLNPALPMVGAVLVGPDGRRFVDESAQGYSKLGTLLMAQPARRALMIWDEEAMRATEDSELMRDSKEAGAWTCYESVEVLAQANGIGSASLALALDGSRTTPGVGRPLRTVVPPLFAAWVTGGILTTQGGLRVDHKGRVLRSDESALLGLYAGGGSAAGVSGPSADGYSSGNGLLCALGFGWIIGHEIAQV